MRKPKSFETVVELDGREVEVVVVYTYSPGHPGQLYGPPENCYPPEGAEAEVEAVYLKDDPTKTDIMPKLKTEVVENLFEQSVTEGEEDEVDRYEAAMEDKADAMREREAFERDDD